LDASTRKVHSQYSLLVRCASECGYVRIYLL